MPMVAHLTQHVPQVVCFHDAGEPAVCPRIARRLPAHSMTSANERHTNSM